MQIDQTGRLVISKEFLRALLVASIDDPASRCRIEVERREPDAVGRNWTTTVEDVDHFDPEDLRRLAGIARSLMVSYNLPSCDDDAGTVRK